MTGAAARSNLLLGVPTGPIVVVNWTQEAWSLVETIASASGDGGRVTCVGRETPAQFEAAMVDQPVWGRLDYVQAPPINDGVETLARALQQIDVANARSIVVLPQRDADEPDASSRVTCVAIARACRHAAVPNIVVEVEDPEAAYEFAGLGVATVFYPGYLRAALLAQACVDLGVFQFVYGLLDGRYRVRLIPVPESVRAGTFVDAARDVEVDDQGNPLTIIGIQKGAEGELVINPGPRTPLDSVLGLLTLGEP